MPSRLIIRCSRLPLAFHCPGSIRRDQDETLIEVVDGDAGPLGSAVHEALASLVLEEDPHVPDLRPIAVKYGVDDKEVGRLVWYGFEAWRELRPAFPDPFTELELDSETPEFSLTGHPDLVSVQGDLLAYADWKSGYRQADFYPQLMGYGSLLLSNFPDAKKIRATLVWLRDHSMQTFSLSREEVVAWETTLAQEVVRWDGMYHAGSHCQWCPRFSSCPARKAIVRSAVEETSGDALLKLLDTAPREVLMPQLAAFWRSGKLALAEQIITRCKDLLKADVSVHGPIDLGNGRELALVPVPRDEIKPLEAWPILGKYLTDTELAGAVKIGKTAMLTAVSDKAPKGKKKAAKDQVMAELEAANAVEKGGYDRMMERNKGE